MPTNHARRIQAPKIETVVVAQLFLCEVGYDGVAAAVRACEKFAPVNYRRLGSQKCYETKEKDGQASKIC